MENGGNQTNFEENDESVEPALDYTEAEVWKLVAGRLRKKSIRAEIRRRLGAPHIVGESDLEDLLDRVKLELLDFRNRRARRKRAAGEVLADTSDHLSREEKLRESVLGSELARLATSFGALRDESTGVK